MLSHAADRLMDSKSLAQFAGDPSVSVLGVIRRGSVAMEVFTALFAVFISYRQGICSGFEVFPHQAYPSAWNSAFKMGRHDVKKMGLVRLLRRWQCFKAAAVLESPCPEFFVFSTANPASAQPQEFPL